MTLPLRPQRLKPGSTINIWYDNGYDFIRRDEPSTRCGGWFPCTVVKTADAVDDIDLHVRHWDGVADRVTTKLRGVASVQRLTQDDNSSNDNDDDDSIAAAPWRNVVTGEIAYLPRPPNLSLGDLVWSNFQREGTYFRGRIAKVHPNDTFDVGYDSYADGEDNDYETNVPRERIIAATSSTSFSERHQWLLDLPIRTFGKLPAGTVTAVHDDGTVDITYEPAAKMKKVIKRDFDVVVHQVFADAMAKYGTVPVAAPAFATKKGTPMNSTKAAVTTSASNSKSTFSKKITTKGSAADKKVGSSTTPTGVSMAKTENDKKRAKAVKAAAPVRQRPAGVTATEQSVKADSMKNFSDDQTAHYAVTENNGILLPCITQPEYDSVMAFNGLSSADANVLQRRAPPGSSIRVHLEEEFVSDEHEENGPPPFDHASMMLLPNQATLLLQIPASSDGPVAVAHLQQLSRTSRRHLPTPELWQHFFNVLVDGPRRSATSSVPTAHK